MQTLNWTALKALHDHFMRTAFSICAKGEVVESQLFAVRANSKGRVVKMTALPPELVSRFTSTDRAKDAFSYLLRDLLTAGSAVREHMQDRLDLEPNVLVQVNEAWMTLLADGKLPDPPERPSERSDRKEVLLISLHTVGLSIPVYHSIVDSPTRHAVQGRFPTESDAKLTTGRFAMQDAFGARDGVKH